MNSRKLRIVLVYVIIYSLYSCEKVDSDIDLSKWSIFTEQDGLNDNHIYSLCIDKSDALWIGTNKGVTKYDGNKFSRYSNLIGNSQITSIAVDSNNNKWFGTFGGGLAMFDGNKWEYYQFSENSSNCIPSNYIRSISVAASGEIWIGTDNSGVSMFDGQKWTNYTTDNGLIDNHVYDISISKLGDKWFGTNGGISKFDGHSWTNYSYDEIAGNGVLSIAIDNNENVWLATFGGISMLNNNVWTNFTTETNWLDAGAPALSVAIDNNNDKWFGSNGWGISKFDGTAWTTFNQINNLDFPPVNAIVIDSNGIKWFGTSEGLIKYE